MISQSFNRCKGECTRYRFGTNAGKSKYVDGAVFCLRCTKYLTVFGVKDSNDENVTLPACGLARHIGGSLLCKCCGNSVRTFPRQGEAKRKYVEYSDDIHKRLNFRCNSSNDDLDDSDEQSDFESPGEIIETLESIPALNVISWIILKFLSDKFELKLYEIKKHCQDNIQHEWSDNKFNEELKNLVDGKILSKLYSENIPESYKLNVKSPDDSIEEIDDFIDMGDLINKRYYESIQIERIN